jgi:hypothetical protein
LDEKERRRKKSRSRRKREAKILYWFLTFSLFSNGNNSSSLDDLYSTHLFGKN